MKVRRKYLKSYQAPLIYSPLITKSYQAPLITKSYQAPLIYSPVIIESYLAPLDETMRAEKDHRNKRRDSQLMKVNTVLF